MNEIRFDHVSKSYDGGTTSAVVDACLAVPAGSLVVLLGPSGCGKTTLLKMVNRLLEPSQGRILLDGEDIRGRDPIELRRGIGYTIQQVGLMPHMTVERNIAMVPRLLAWPAERIRSRVEELLELVGLDPAGYRRRYPSQLSGGEQQRVGIARALAADPGVLLMDEPFGALDAITRRDLQDEICRLRHQLQTTILFVTHDVDEALRLADSIVVMQHGRVVQHAAPVQLLAAPANDFVRRLLSSEDRIRQLGLVPAAAVMEALPAVLPGKTAGVDSGSTVREVLNLLLAPDTSGVVVREMGNAVGWITLETIRVSGKQAEAR